MATRDLDPRHFLATIVLITSSWPSASAQEAGEVLIARDVHGIPHIYGTTDEAAYFGLGYACARDRIFQMSFLRATIKGELAKWLGRPGGSDVYVNHDKDMKRFGFYDHIVLEQLWPSMQVLHPKVAGLLTAYAAGVEYYVTENQMQLQNALVPAEIAAMPRSGWTAPDIIAAWLEFARRLGGLYADDTEVLNRLVYDCYVQGGTPPSVAAGYLEDCDVVFDEQGASVPYDPALEAAIEDYLAGLYEPFDPTMKIQPPRFDSLSQAWAVGRDLLDPEDDVKAVLFGHPQIPLSKPGLFWEAHVSGATFEVRGAAVPGTPNFMVGATDTVAWTATRLVMDTDDIYRLTMNAAGDAYWLDGQWEPVRVVPKTVEILGEPPVSIEYRESWWGPIVGSLFDPFTLNTPPCADENLPPCNVPTGNVDYAVRLPHFFRPDHDPALGFFRMYHADNAHDFYKKIGKVNWPPFNCVFADADGLVGYCIAGGIPVRKQAAIQFGAVAQDGDDTANDWWDLLPQDYKPHTIGTEYAFSANNLPVSDWYPIPIHAGGGHTDRSRRVKERLDELAGQAPVSADDVLLIYRDDVWGPARDITKMANHLIATEPPGSFPYTTEAAMALAELDTWVAAGGHLGDSVPPNGPPKDDGRAFAIKVHVFQLFNSVDSLTSLYGKREAGAAYWMRCRTDAIDGNCVSNPGTCPPAQGCVTTFTADEKQLVSDVLDAAWTKLEASVGGSQNMNPTGWEDWFQNTHLARTVKRWTFFNLPFGPFPLGPGLGSPLKYTVTVDWSETIFSQGSQHYSQGVRLGPSTTAPTPDQGLSLMPLGEAEVEGTTYYKNLEGTWLGMQLKPFFTTPALAIHGQPSVVFTYP